MTSLIFVLIIGAVVYRLWGRRIDRLLGPGGSGELGPAFKFEQARRRR